MIDFWQASPTVKGDVINAFARTGVKAVVAEKPPVGMDLSGWQKIRDTDYYVYLLNILSFLRLFVAEVETEPAENKCGGAVKVVQQVQREREDRKREAFAMVEEPIEFVIENRNYSQQHNDQ